MPRSTIVFALALAGIGVACGGATPDADVAAPPAAGDEVVIDFWYMPNGPEPAAHLAREAEEFSRLHPGVTIELTELPWESALTRIITAATSGVGPDVVQIGTTWVPGIAALDALSPLTDTDLRVVGGREAFVGASWTSTEPVGSDATVAVPWFLDTRVAFYRTDVFEELGLDPAVAFSDWEGFEASLATIDRAGDVAPLAVSGANDWNVVHDLAPWVWAGGGDFLAADASQATVDGTGAVHGVHTFQRLVAAYNHPAALDGSASDAHQLFAQGEAAVTFGAPFVVSELREADADGAPASGRWATASLPRGPGGRHAFLGGSNLAVFARSDVRAEALAWIAFLTSETSQVRYATDIGMLPAREAALHREGFLADPVYEPFAAQLRDGRQYPAVPEWLHVEVALQHHVGNLWRAVATGGALSVGDVATRLGAAARDIDDALATGA